MNKALILIRPGLIDFHLRLAALYFLYPSKAAPTPPRRGFPDDAHRGSRAADSREYRRAVRDGFAPCLETATGRHSGSFGSSLLAEAH